MRKQWHLVCVLSALLGGACGDSGTSSEQDNSKGANESELKQKARAAAANASSPVSSDACAKNDWYDDGQCDAWCPKGDKSDCTVASPDEPVECALFFSEADGKCDRDDPCGPVQDADCQAKPGDGCGEPPVACIEILFPTNGKCEPAAGCEYTDPTDCGTDDLICPAIWSPADGKCDESDPCGPATDEDCQGGGTDPGDGDVACIEIAYETNGKCEAAAGCEYTDPDDCAGASEPSDPGGGLVCPAIYREKDGKCPSDDPCDPDC